MENLYIFEKIFLNIFLDSDFRKIIEKYFG